jgi:hypothetical protein
VTEVIGRLAGLQARYVEPGAVDYDVRWVQPVG